MAEFSKQTIKQSFAKNLWQIIFNQMGTSYSRIISFLLLSLLLVVLTSCQRIKGESDIIMFSGQWSPVLEIGDGKKYIEGYQVRDALEGARDYCQKQHRGIVVKNILEQTFTKPAAVQFYCQ